MSKCMKTIRAFRMEKILKKGAVRSKKFIPVQLDHPVVFTANKGPFIYDVSIF